MNTQTPQPQLNYLKECDYQIVLYDAMKQRLPVSWVVMRSFTISFDKKTINLSIYLNEMEDPIEIGVFQAATVLEINYKRNEMPPVTHNYEVLDVVGSIRGSLNSTSPLSYVVQFMLK